MANHRRSEWSDVNAWFSPMGQADGIAIHHTASVPRMDEFDPDYLRRIEHGEINNGYNALAYHSMFMANGDSAESRPYGAMGAATGGHNDHTIAFCVPGYFHSPYNDESTTALERAMATEIQVLVYLGFLSPDYVVMGHRDWTRGTQWATACPGDLLYPRVEVIDALSRGGSIPAPVIPPPPSTGGSTNTQEIHDMYVAWGQTVFGVPVAALISGSRKLLDLNGPPGAYGIPQPALDWKSVAGRESVPFVFLDPTSLGALVA